MPKKRKISTLKAFLLIGLVTSIQFSNAQIVEKYINEYRPLAEQLSVKYGIPSSIILGIAIVESSAGKGKNVKLLHNHFGIVGKNNLRKTKGIKTKFKAYETNEDSYIAFCEMIARKKYYPELKNNCDYHLWLNAMAKAGYSTSPEIWKKLIGNAIKKYKLE